VRRQPSAGAAWLAEHKVSYSRIWLWLRRAALIDYTTDLQTKEPPGVHRKPLREHRGFELRCSKCAPWPVVPFLCARTRSRHSGHRKSAEDLCPRISSAVWMSICWPFNMHVVDFGTYASVSNDRQRDRPSAAAPAVRCRGWVGRRFSPMTMQNAQGLSTLNCSKTVAVHTTATV
jgi:hypothetical protein